MMLDYLTYAALALLVIIFLSQAIRILREYERGVVFTLGRFTGVKGPGLIILIPVVQQLVKVGDYMAATSQLAQTTLRSVLGKHELDEMLAERDRLSADIQEILDKQTEVWGIKVTAIEIKDVDLNET